MLVKSAPLKPAALPNAQPAVYKPLTESWSVGTETYSSTADLLAHATELDGKAAVYHYTSSADVAPYTGGEKVCNAIGAGLTGAVYGAAGGAMAGGMLAIGGTILGVVNMVLGGRESGVGMGLLLVPTLLGAAGVGIASGIEGYHDEGKAPETTVDGQLQNLSGKLTFYPHGQVENKVDLNAFDQSPQAPMAVPEENLSSPVLNTLKGAAVGAALPAITAIPILGQMLPFAVGTRVGAALDPRTQLGQGIGRAAGVGLMLGTWAAGSSYQLAGIGALSAVTALTGAALGDKVFSASEAAHHDFGTQWWNRDALAAAEHGGW